MATITAPPASIESRDPSTGEPIGTIPAGDAATVDAAVRAARAAHPAWVATPAAERAAALKRVAALVRAHGDDLARGNAHESGKLIADARAGVEAAAGAIEQYAELGPLHRGRALQGAPGAIDLVAFEPRGVVAAIVSWDDPIAIAGQGLAAALATGNTVVLKPSERTPYCSESLYDLFAQELPRGVVRLVQGDARAGRPLVAHEGVDVVLHTGAAATGREIAVACAARGAKAILALGGNDPLIVDRDVDPAWAAAQAASGAFAHAGQSCVSVERIYVHEAIADAFVHALIVRARGLRMGSALDPESQLGPLVDARARAAVHGQVDAALRSGAHARCGGAPVDGPGCFYPATVLVDVDDTMGVMCEETFGPVAPVAAVASFEEALERANASAYGLAATVLTASQKHAQRAARVLRAGTVKVNSMWGGAPGGSAHPRGVSGSSLGHGPELLDELTVLKAIHLAPAVP